MKAKTKIKKSFLLSSYLLLVACGSERQINLIETENLLQENLNQTVCPSSQVKDSNEETCRNPRIGHYAYEGKEKACNDILNKQSFTSHGGTSPQVAILSVNLAMIKMLPQEIVLEVQVGILKSIHMPITCKNQP